MTSRSRPISRSARAHQRAGDIEEAVRARCPQLVDIIVHTEPATDGAAR